MRGEREGRKRSGTLFTQKVLGGRERERERDKMMGAGSARHKKGAGLLCLSSRLCISK